MADSKPLQPSSHDVTPSWRSLDCLLLTILAIVSVYNFVRRGPTAFEWPGTDMACFYERLADPSFLPNDYYTNSIVESNPRHVFGYFIVAVARVFGTDWYSVYFALRVVQTLAVPMLWYLAMLGLVRRYLIDERRQFLARLALAIAVVCVMRRDVSAWFSIAWWPPYFQYVGAHPFAIFLGLIGIVVRTSIAGPTRYLSLVIWFWASLVHPAIGLFMVAFYLLCEYDRLNWREIVTTALIGAILPAVLLTIWFRPQDPLSAPEFVNLYVASSHPFHYQVAQFATLTKYPWWVSFAIVLSSMIAAASVGYWRGDRPLAKLAGAFALSYSGCVLLQYLGTDIWPSRSIAALGPSRFSFLGFYMVAMLATLVLCGTERPQLAAHRNLWHRLAPGLHLFQPAGVVVATLAAAIVMITILKDDIQHDVRQEYAGLYDWIERNTAPEDVFLPTFNHELHKQLPVIGRRALFASQTFPFREEAIPEHIRRLTLAYGTPQTVAKQRGRDQIAQRTNYFRALTPADILAMARLERLNYVIVESDHREQFAGYPASYADDSIAVYSVHELQRAAGKRDGANPAASIGAHNALRSTLQ